MALGAWVMADVKANLNGEEFSPEEVEAARVTALALGQRDESAPAGDGVSHAKSMSIRAFAAQVAAARAGENLPEPSANLRGVVSKRLSVEEHRAVALAKPVAKSNRQRRLAI